MTSSEYDETRYVMAADADVVIYRRYDDNYIVRSMTLDDAVIVQKWYLENMGVISKYDLSIALSSFPASWKGFYIGEFQGRVVASAVCIPWRSDLCYASYYYVENSHRGRGFGTRLRDQVAWEHLGSRMLCLDSVIGQTSRKNEEKFGYRPAFKTGMYEATVMGAVEANILITVLQVSVQFNSRQKRKTNCLRSWRRRLKDRRQKLVC